MHNQVTWDLKYEYDPFDNRTSRTETTYTFGDGGEGHSIVTGSTTKDRVCRSTPFKLAGET
jgi:hypothetical protein